MPVTGAKRNSSRSTLSSSPTTVTATINRESRVRATVIPNDSNALPQNPIRWDSPEPTKQAKPGRTDLRVCDRYPRRSARVVRQCARGDAQARGPPEAEGRQRYSFDDEDNVEPPKTCSYSRTRPGSGRRRSRSLQSAERRT
jgi:hypothetical protein